MSSDETGPFGDLVAFDKAATKLLEIAEATWQLNRVIAKHTGGVVPLVPGNVPIVMAWKSSFGTPYYDTKEKP